MAAGALHSRWSKKEKMEPRCLFLPTLRSDIPSAALFWPQRPILDLYGWRLHKSMILKTWGAQGDIFIQTTTRINSPPSPEDKTGLWRARQKQFQWQAVSSHAVSWTQCRCTLFQQLAHCRGWPTSLSFSSVVILFSDAFLPVCTTWHCSGSPQSSPCFISFESSEQSGSLIPFPCFIGVFKHCMLIVCLCFTTHPATCSCNPGHANACSIPIPGSSIPREMLLLCSFWINEEGSLKTTGFNFFPHRVGFSPFYAINHGLLLPLVAEVLNILNKFHFMAKALGCV